MSISIKTVLDDNIHRFNLITPTFDELERAMSAVYGKRAFCIRYQDEDEDMISISSTLELQEALRVAGGKPLRLVLSRVENQGDAFVCVHTEAKAAEGAAARKAAEEAARAEAARAAAEEAARAEAARAAAEEAARAEAARAEAARAAAEEAARAEAARAAAEEAARAKAARAAAEEAAAREKQAAEEAARREADIAAEEAAAKKAQLPECAKARKAAAARAFWEAEEARDVLEKARRAADESKWAAEQAKAAKEAEKLEQSFKAAEEESKEDGEDLRMLALELLNDPEVQALIPGLSRAVLAAVIEEIRKGGDRSESAGRILDVVTANSVLKGKESFVALLGYKAKAQRSLARLLGSIPRPVVELLDRLKAGLNVSANTLLAWLSNPPSFDQDEVELDLGVFDLPSLGLSMAELSPMLESLCGVPSSPVELRRVDAESVHSNIRCDGCNVFPIRGVRYQCTVCRDYDLCGACEAKPSVHPVEHPLVKHRQAVSDVVVHRGVTCDNCDKSPIVGARFKCRICPDFDLCAECEAKNVHPADHPMLKLKREQARPMGGWGGCGRRWPMGGAGMRMGGGWGRRVLEQGSCGHGVKRVQEVLKIPVDGYFGPQTEQAVKQFQAAHGLKVDGIVGPLTRMALFRGPASSSPSSPAAHEQAQPSVTVEEVLVSMGFSDRERNVELVRQHNGDIEAILTELFRA